MNEFENEFKEFEERMMTASLMAAAVTYHELYSSFMAAGFDEDQAMTLLIATINRSGEA